MHDRDELFISLRITLPLLLLLIVVYEASAVTWKDSWHLFAAYFAASFVAMLFVLAQVSLWINFQKRQSSDRAEPAICRSARTPVVSLSQIVRLLTPVTFFTSLLAAYSIFKQFILPGAGFRDDRALAWLDHKIFFGHEPWTVTHALFPHPLATLLFDYLYKFWFLPMIFGVMVACLLPAARRLRAQYLISFALTWIIGGMVMGYFMPSAGPCYYENLVGAGDRYAPLMATLRNQELWLSQHGFAGLLTALSSQNLLLNYFQPHATMIGGGISAMPSMHVGLAVLFALALSSVSRPWGWAAGVYAFFIWIASIHLGWHYAADGIVSAAMVFLIWRMTGKAVEGADRARSRPFSSMGSPQAVNPR